jgi:hypothetical protein
MTTTSELMEMASLAKGSLDLLNTAIGLMPTGTDRDALQEKADQGEKSLQAAEANIAKDLGYDLCKCMFPPQIMLWKQDKKMMVCDSCGNSTDKNFNRPIRYAPPKRGGGWWMGA